MVNSDFATRISTAAQALHAASRKIRILTHLSWPLNQRRAFLRDQTLPRISYPSFDEAAALDLVNQARAYIDPTNDPAALEDAWLQDIARQLERSAAMLASCATPGFFTHSRNLYGAPRDRLRDNSATPLQLANSFDELFQDLNTTTQTQAPQPRFSAAEAVDRISATVSDHFGTAAPKVYVDDNLSANALAGAKRIRLRGGAWFSDNDIAQLIQHEAFIHVATALNGAAQASLPILAASHAGTTTTQEGLAVFAEFISGTMDIDRFRRLADRVTVTQMAIDGADFVEVFRFYRARDVAEAQAYENARRVFRGGVLSGGAPFTKDIVYLNGLVRVHNFLRTAVAAGRADCMTLLFCGKLDLEHLPALGKLNQLGLCKAPRFLPPWIADNRFLLSYLAYSSFLNSIDLGQVGAHYADLLTQTPVLENL